MWNFLKCCLVLAVLSTDVTFTTTAVELAPIFWNSSSTLFKSSSSSDSIEVRLYDQIDLMCPYYNFEEDSMESYVIYLVSKKEFDDCQLSKMSYMLVNCSAPTTRRRYTIQFISFQPVPNSPEFVGGEAYYIISTSTGTTEGLKNTIGGVCRTNNMRLSFYVKPMDVESPIVPGRTVPRTDSKSPTILSKTVLQPQQTSPSTSLGRTSVTKPIRRVATQRPATYSVYTFPQGQTNSKQTQDGANSSASSSSFACLRSLTSGLQSLVLLLITFIFSCRL